MGDTFKPIVDADEDRLIRMAEAKYLTGLSRSSLIRKSADPKDDFPSAVRLGVSSRGWHLWEVRSWLRTRART